MRSPAVRSASPDSREASPARREASPARREASPAPRESGPPPEPSPVSPKPSPIPAKGSTSAAHTPANAASAQTPCHRNGTPCRLRRRGSTTAGANLTSVAIASNPPERAARSDSRARTMWARSTARISAASRKRPTESKWALQEVSTISSGDQRYQMRTARTVRPRRRAISARSIPQPRSKRSQSDLERRMSVVVADGPGSVGARWFGVGRFGGSPELAESVWSRRTGVPPFATGSFAADLFATGRSPSTIRPAPATAPKRSCATGG